MQLGSKIARRRAFTLVELLVVIGIIGLLVAILLPTLSKARRSAVVMASPVAYNGTDKRVHLTDPSGKMDLPLTPAVGNRSCRTCHAPPLWSPNGLKVGVRGLTTALASVPAVIDPLAKKPEYPMAGGQTFVGWLDSERFLHTNSTDAMSIVNVDTRAVQPVSSRQQIVCISPAPPNSPGPYVGNIFEPTADLICFIRSDLTAGRPIWSEPRNGGAKSQDAPRVDPMGEYVAWTLYRNGRASVAMKSVKDSSIRPPNILSGAYSVAYFCDWSEQGELLCNVSSGMGWRLVLLGTDGSLRRELAVDPPPVEGVSASWRKYGHR